MPLKRTSKLLLFGAPVAVLFTLGILFLLIFTTLRSRTSEIQQADQLLRVYCLYAVNHDGRFPSGAAELASQGYITFLPGDRAKARVNTSLSEKIPSHAPLRVFGNLNAAVAIDLDVLTPVWGLDVGHLEVGCNSKSLFLKGQPVWLLEGRLYSPSKETFPAVSQVDWTKEVQKAIRSSDEIRRKEGTVQLSGW